MEHAIQDGLYHGHESVINDGDFSDINRFPETEEEANLIEESIAKAMANLSVDEEERILFEMYGFPIGFEKEEEIHQGSLTPSLENTGDIYRSRSVSQWKDQREQLSRLENALERRLKSVQDSVRTTYQRTLEANPSFLHQQGLLFVAAVKGEGEEDNFNDAAKLLLDHLEVKSELFSESTLARHVEWTDLAEMEQEMVSAGCFQFATAPDALGRIILHWSAHRVIEMMDKFKGEDFAVILLRSLWYTIMLGLQSNSHMLNNGLVISMCNLTTRPLPFSVAKSGRRMFWRIPFRFRCAHIFHTNPALHICYRAYQLASGLFTTGKRFNIHVHMATSMTEMKVKMMSFGLNPAASPWASCSCDAIGWSRQSHLEWLERQKSRERLTTSSSKEGSTGFVLTPSEIRPFDVLLGRERKCTEHVGTRRCKVIVGLKLELYELSNVQEKTKIANDIVDYICQSGGRFLRFENGQWSQVSLTVARQKVAHYFRFLRGKGKKHVKDLVN